MASIRAEEGMSSLGSEWKFGVRSKASHGDVSSRALMKPMRCEHRICENRLDSDRDNWNTGRSQRHRGEGDLTYMTVDEKNRDKAIAGTNAVCASEEI